MPIDPVKIPQNIYVEDRIIGPITLRQIIIVLLGSGFSYAIWSSMQAAGLTTPIHTGIAWTPAVIATAFAFMKINDISLFRMCLLLAERMEKPRIRQWSPRQGISINIVTSKLVTEEPTPMPHKQFEESKIQTLSKMLDKGPEEDEIEEPALEAEQEEMVPMQSTSSRPVDPRRVSVDTGNESIDTIRKQTPAEVQTPTPNMLLRDIHPPLA